ncbi:rhodanese-related sulfurtransferase [Pseudaminobacter salicylatoxidans]|uniref:Rhodanese-related sulfurtransferase n=1 Tax=Pseudaminobacter salicylatoxidans TaxID=93369 RepID=A0A316CER3_PSESE|nr:rhodanese-like domain-containing protein [Pseudaminobacter salicylatoxidans]PWJ86597.1 rhodanese-related sulfurtransferase [Pseudaminobacter salicylatoxidans]
MAIRNTMTWVDSLRAQVPTLSAVELAERIGRSEPLTLVDIRELQERIDSGAIPNSHHVPRGMLEFWADPAMGYHRSFFTEGAEYVVYCAGGGRSVLAALALMDMGYDKVWHLDHGFGGWNKEGRPVEDVAATSRWQRKY